MFKYTVALMLASGAVCAGGTFAQTLPNPTQTTTTAPQQQLPTFRITVVGRTTAAINYRPRHDDTRIDFAGTTLMPRARGEATVSGEKGHTKIDAQFNRLESASRFGAEYLTYVLWAVTPEGRATNLGEIQVDHNDADAKMEVTTELQAFALIVTAEPYFAVTQPSDVVIMENVVRQDTKGDVEIVNAKYELLTRGAYLMNHDAATLKLKPLEPGSTLDLAQARNAVELARVAGADRFAKDTFDKAVRLLATAEDAKTRKQGSNAIMMPARQAVQTAEDTRIISLRKQEDAYQADQRAQGLAREQSAVERAQSEEAKRKQAELEMQTATTARLAAERDKAASDAARLAAERDRAAADAARLAADRDKVTADAARLAADRDKMTAAEAARVAAERDKMAAAEASRLAAERDKMAAAEAARVAAERDKMTADAARLAAETARKDAETARLASEAQARSAAAQSEQEKAVLREQLRAQLNLILETRESARGLVVNLSDVLFDTGSATLKTGAREKLARLSGILASHPGLRIAVEGHTDNVGTEDSNQRLSERRGEIVRSYLVQQGIPSATVVSAGLGESQPVATNDTAAGRQQNRRVEVIVSGDLIGKTGREK